MQKSYRTKSAAKRAAWKVDSKWDSYNPFSRTTSRQTVLSRDAPVGASNYDEEAAVGGRRFGAKKARTFPPTVQEKPSDIGPAASPSSNTDVESMSGGAAGEYYNGNSKKADGPSRTSSGNKSLLKDVPEDAEDKRPESSDSVSTDAETEEERKRRHDEAFKKKIPLLSQFRTVLFPKWLTINWLLIAAPVGIALNFTNVDPLAVFIINFIAIIPLAGILSFATEEIAMRVGEVLGGLLNASFGNAVELIVGIIALAKKEIVIVQTSLIGSMLSNLLLVLGMCFFFGGLQREEQHFNTVVAQTATSILALAVGAILIPTAFTWGQGAANPAGGLDEELSYGTAVIMLVVYGCYLFFQLKSHKEVYNAPSKKVEKRKRKHRKQKGDTEKAFAQIGGVGAGASGGQNLQRSPYKDNDAADDEDEEVPSLSMLGAMLTLLGATALIGVCAEFLVDSINEVTCKYGVSQYFVGLILLPIAGNVAEHATAVTVAIKDKLNLSLGVAIGSSIQIALLVLPFLVILGWIMSAAAGGDGTAYDLTLVFDDFQIVVLFIAVILVNYLISDGKSHWLEGVLLMALYVVIAVASWFYPKEQEGTCGA